MLICSCIFILERNHYQSLFCNSVHWYRLICGSAWQAVSAGVSFSVQIQFHTGGKPLYCFLYVALQIHNHTGEKQFLFVELHIHRHTGEKQFVYSLYFNLHMHNHTGEKPLLIFYIAIVYPGAVLSAGLHGRLLARVFLFSVGLHGRLLAQEFIISAGLHGRLLARGFIFLRVCMAGC